MLEGAATLLPLAGGMAKGAYKTAGKVPLASQASPAAFFGEGSKTLPYKRLEMAKGLAKSDATPEEIFDQTGFFKGTEGKWKYEVPEDNLAFRGGNLDYIWSRAGSNFSGSAADLSLPTVTTAHAGNYRVTVSNAGGTDISAPILLAVVRPLISSALITGPLPSYPNLSS